ncbi:hypothetical protein AB0K18_09520 [Nonomuraea sp. NPDC049421]|uniref:hypothetical protein n=1 Tax=Nonomuraea sp. NPDC049421 TaxID=3155275 RepID=UPI0034196DE3
MVPVAHGQWLTAHLRNVRAHIERGHGHISIGVGTLGDKLDRLRSRVRESAPVRSFWEGL